MGQVGDQEVRVGKIAVRDREDRAGSAGDPGLRELALNSEFCTARALSRDLQDKRKQGDKTHVDLMPGKADNTFMVHQKGIAGNARELAVPVDVECDMQGVIGRRQGVRNQRWRPRVVEQGKDHRVVVNHGERWCTNKAKSAIEEDKGAGSWWWRGQNECKRAREETIKGLFIKIAKDNAPEGSRERKKSDSGRVGDIKSIGVLATQSLPGGKTTQSCLQRNW
ncbi:hypothetical protein B0H14DRAFT_2619740 [Mycena olivaceomarginata]|nr:hypothetical protein B0H14DRAFT_2619740 [Mycena olivaceomarginata]